MNIFCSYYLFLSLRNPNNFDPPVHGVTFFFLCVAADDISARGIVDLLFHLRNLKDWYMYTYDLREGSLYIERVIPLLFSSRQLLVGKFDC